MMHQNSRLKKIDPGKIVIFLREADYFNKIRYQYLLLKLIHI